MFFGPVWPGDKEWSTQSANVQTFALLPIPVRHLRPTNNMPYGEKTACRQISKAQSTRRGAADLLARTSAEPIPVCWPALAPKSAGSLRAIRWSNWNQPWVRDKIG